jgi:hypothetical protein
VQRSLSPRSPRLCAYIALAGLTPGCLAHYQPPRADEPHALVSVRRTYLTQPPFADETRWERILLDGAIWSNQVTRSQPEQLHAEDVRVRPGPLRIQVSTQFSHFEQRPVQQVVEVEDTDAQGRPARHKRSEIRTVYAPVEVQDDRCDVEVAARFTPDREYLLQYEYRGYRHCQLSCLERALSGPLAAADPKPCER